MPAISDDGVIVFESPAIALNLTDKFPKKHLGPLVGEIGRGAYLSWLCESSRGPPLRARKRGTSNNATHSTNH